MIEDSYTFDQNGGILPGEILYAGTEQDAFSGWAVGGSDLNGDGFDDLIITDNASDPLGRTDAGSAWIISGWDQGGPGDKTGQRIPLDSNTKALRIYGEKPNDFFGKSVASGDFNNDGAGDLVITSVWADNPSLQPADNNAGAAYIIYGARNSNLGSNRIEKLNVSTAADPRIKTLGDFGPTLRLKVEYPTDQPESVHIVSYGASMFSIVPDKSASPVWSLNEQGLPENIPCRVTVKYTENQALSLLESRFQLYHNSGSRGTVLAQDQQVDTRRNTITGTISGFRGDLQIGYSEAVTLSAITLRDADGAFGVEDEFTNARTVTVRLGTIGFGPPQTIELAENPEFTNLTSINYEGEDEVSYQLSDTGDGVRTVYARARKNGTTSNVVSDSIKLDTVPPAAMLTADRVTNGGTLGSAGKVVFTASFSDANTFGGFNPTDDRYIRLENATLGAGSGDTFEVTPSGQEVRVVVQLLEGAARDHAGNLSAPSAEFAFDYNVLGPSPVPGGELRYVSGSTALNNVNAVFEVTFSEPIQSIDIGQLRPGLHPTAVSLSASTVDRSNLTLTTEQSVDNAAGPYRIRVQGTVPAGGDLVVQFRRNTIFDFDSNGLDPTGIEGRVELGKPQPVQASGWIFN
jgi:hypothetical protein